MGNFISTHRQKQRRITEITDFFFFLYHVFYRILDLEIRIRERNELIKRAIHPHTLCNQMCIHNKSLSREQHGTNISVKLNPYFCHIEIKRKRQASTKYFENITPKESFTISYFFHQECPLKDPTSKFMITS